MNIYFDRTIPFYLTDQVTFEGTPVDVPVAALRRAQAMRILIDLTERAILDSASPERSNQELAERFAVGLMASSKTTAKKGA